MGGLNPVTSSGGLGVSKVLQGGNINNAGGLIQVRDSIDSLFAKEYIPL